MRNERDVDPRTKRIYEWHRKHGATPVEAMRQAKWQRDIRVLSSIGDVNWLAHGGGPIVKNVETGEVWLEWIEPPGGGIKKYTVYRIDLDREPLPSWIKAKDVARSIGSSPTLLRKNWNSPNVMKRAMARWDVAGYYGWHELDSYPLVLTKAEVQRRYRKRA